MSSNNQRDDGRRRIVAPQIGVASATRSWMMLIPIWLGSATIQICLLGLFFLIATFAGAANAGSNGKTQTVQVDTRIEDPDPPEVDLTNPDIGNDTNKLTNYNNDNIKEISVPGAVNRNETPGILNGTDPVMRSIPPPAGTGGGTGGALDTGTPGVGQWAGTPGGMGGRLNPGGYGGRTGSTREQMLEEGGGNKESEAAVARGLAWLAAHQATDGHWSLHKFPEHARDKSGQPVGKAGCGCTPGTNRHNDPAATGLALLPFLGAGHTQRPLPGSKQVDYSKVVLAGLSYLLKIQVRGGANDGYLGGDPEYVGNMYGHAIATIALCEAYGMTNDPALRGPAQRAVTFIVNAQSAGDPAEGGGGWRYSPKTTSKPRGDTSVTGWMVMALQSGHMAGLAVPAKTWTNAEEYLEKCKSEFDSPSDTGKKLVGYGYTPGTPATGTMTAAALLCREYLGINPKNPELLRGVEYLKQLPPGKSNDLYFEYYATQVFHHIGGPTWQFWNLGPDGSGKGGIRDTLISKQDKGTDGKTAHQFGSWNLPGADFKNDGGRIMWTSLALLSLEVYYRHLPLYGKDFGTKKETTP
jgi:hypothetical protein